MFHYRYFSERLKYDGFQICHRGVLYARYKFLRRRWKCHLHIRIARQRRQTEVSEELSKKVMSESQEYKDLMI